MRRIKKQPEVYSTHSGEEREGRGRSMVSNKRMGELRVIVRTGAVKRGKGRASLLKAQRVGAAPS